MECSLVFKVLFFEPEELHLGINRTRIKPRSFRRLPDIPMDICELSNDIRRFNVINHFALDVLKTSSQPGFRNLHRVFEQKTVATCFANSFTNSVREIFKKNLLPVRNQNGALNNIDKLPDISRPGIVVASFQGGF
jgi:hypothetical protein